MDKVYYMCESQYIDTNSDSVILDYLVPLYENVDLNDEYNMESLMDLFSWCGERCYFSVNIDNLEEKLVRVKNVDTNIFESELKIQFLFEDGNIYEPNCEFVLEEDTVDYEGLCPFEEVEKLIKIVDASHKAASHLFFLKDMDLRCNMLVYEDEKWG